MAPSPIIRLSKVSKSFKDVQAIKDLSFTVSKGEIVGLLGPNGAGKTTVVRLINGVIAADAGTVEIFGQSPLAESNSIRSRTGVLTESAGLYGHMTAKENLAFFARIYGVQDYPSRIDMLLQEFGLAEYKDRKAETFSTGMRKRLGIAKALIHRPDVLFLDEPTTGLDPEASRDLLGYIKELNARDGVTIVLATHLLRQVQELCHRFLFLHRGQLIESGTLRQLEDKYLKSFQVKVESDLKVEGPSYRGFPLHQVEPGVLIFTVETKSQVPELLRQILSEASVYSAEILGRDLETLYFNVRGNFRG